MIGSRWGTYEIVDKLGAGGMGEVYRARDTTLGRDVAIKALPAELADGESEALERLRREAKLLAALNHPNIATIHAIEEGPEGPFLVLEYVAGETLSERIGEAGLDADDVVAVCEQVARGLAAAHAGGIVHRDLKPANVMITGDGLVKVLDFGIGKSTGPIATGADDDTAVSNDLTADGTLLGTIPYMSPEGIRGGEVDERSDIWAFGCLLHEAITGRSPFLRETVADTLSAILEQPPDEIGRRDVPAEVPEVAASCLQKDPAQRPATMDEVADRLAPGAAGPEVQRAARNWRRLAAGAAVTAVAASAFAWFFFQQLGVRHATDELLPRVEALIAEGQYADAAALAREAEEYLPDSEQLAALWPRMARDVSIATTPEDANVSISAVRRPRFAGENVFVAGDWRDLGPAPIELERLPLGAYRIRVEAEGFRTRELIDVNLADEEGGVNDWRLFMGREGRIPDDMVQLGPFKMVGCLRGIEGYDPQPDSTRNTRYQLGKFEVTNQQYKGFVDAGGYTDPQYWNEPFERDGIELSFEEAMATFRDATGRAGPATWEAGTFPPGEDDHPVGGVSWYEAAAYAAYAGLELPTIYHWCGAKDNVVDMSVFGNFRGDGSLPVASSQFGQHGVYDLSGNVREWASNASGDLRYTLGGGWSDPGYVFHNGDLAPPWDRSTRNGIRIADLGDVPADEMAALSAAVDAEVPSGMWGEAPASDDVFEVLAAQYEYDPRPLDAVVQSVEDTIYWTRETVVIDTAFGERMPVYVFLPKNAQPPFQTLVYFPGAGAINDMSSEALQGMEMFDHALRSGRAVVHPIYTSTYERFDGIPNNGRSRTRAYADRKQRWVLDARRAVDYLETRDEFDLERLAYWGLSWGAEIAPITLAVDSRFRAGVLMDAGALLVPVLPEADESNFAPRVDVPILMINGRYDYIFPVEAAQRPLFELLATPADSKRHELFDSGHVVIGSFFEEAMGVMAAWLDEVFGPVR